MNPRSYNGLKVLLFLAALFALVLSLLPGEWIRAGGDRLASDGELEMLTESVILVFRLVCLVFGGFALFWLLSLLRDPERFTELLTGLRDFPGALARDGQTLRMGIRNLLRFDCAATRVAFWVILALGIGLRVALIHRPMLHDESYTVVTWAAGSFRYALSDYHLPNNHVLHTLAVWFLVHFVGRTPWIVRLPSFLAGIALLPAVFFLGKRIYDEPVGLLAMALTACSSFLIDYATNARGYSFLALAAVTVWLAADGLRVRKNRVLVLVTALIATAGFFTLPMMVYPFGAMCLWLFFAMLNRSFGSDYRNRPDFLGMMFRMGLIVVFLTLCCYLPLLLESGPNALFGNIFVQPLPRDDFLPTLISRRIDFWNVFRDGLTDAGAWLVLVGAVFATIHHCAVARDGCSPIPALTMALWLAPLWMIQRPNLWPRTLIFLFPFLYLWGSAGILDFIRLILRSVTSQGALRLQNGVVMGGMWFMTIALMWVAVERTGGLREQNSPHEAAVLDIIASQDDLSDVLFVVAPEDDAPNWYYAYRYDLEKRLFDRNRYYETVYAFVNPANEGYEEPRDPEGVIERYGPGWSFVDWPSQTTVDTWADGRYLLRFDARMDLIEKEYGLKRDGL